MQVHAEIDESPFDTFTFVLFLLKNEHVMVEELLQFLICEVNTQLFKTVVLDMGFFLWVTDMFYGTQCICKTFMMGRKRL